MSQSKKKGGGGVGSEAERKRKLKQEEIFGVKRSKMEVDRSIVTLKKDIEEKSIEASKKETYDEMKLCLDQGNSFRDILKKKEETAKDLATALGKLEGELNA